MGNSQSNVRDHDTRHLRESDCTNGRGTSIGPRLLRLEVRLGNGDCDRKSNEGANERERKTRSSVTHALLSSSGNVRSNAELPLR